jgi:6-phosphofructokinase 2
LSTPKVDVKSAVGAGDSFVGGITVGLARGLPVDSAFALGVAAGTAAVLTAGSELCRREDVERLYLQMTGGPLPV